MDLSPAVISALVEIERNGVGLEIEFVGERWP
jgi:hypothetical protein